MTVPVRGILAVAMAGRSKSLLHVASQPFSVLQLAAFVAVIAGMLIGYCNNAVHGAIDLRHGLAEPGKTGLHL